MSISSTSSPLSIAVVGGGVAGIVAAHLLSKKHNVTLFESADYLGGHTNTITIPNGPDAGSQIDTGFIVLNDRTYPNFHKFLEALSVPVRYANMSFSFHCERENLVYGSLDLNMLFAQRRNIIRPSFWRLLVGMKQFWDSAKRALANPSSLDGVSLAQFAERSQLPEEVIENYLIPIGGAIWSSSKTGMLDFPSETFLRFFEKHGLLGYFDQPKWQTVVGGSQSYVRAFKSNFRGRINLNSKITSIKRNVESVEVIDRDSGTHRFDHLIMAVHADQVLALLETPSPREQEIFGAWRYQSNPTVLHTDATFLPPIPRAWASWNYRREIAENGQEPISITYYMNLLQGIVSSRHYCVTLNPRRSIPGKHIVKEIDYMHPVYTIESLAAQKRLSTIQGEQRTCYCGSYFGFGFHEDAVRSSVAVGALFGETL